MARITLQLLRKRAEHNNMELSTLEEVSLHQENIEKIELLDRACKNLKILYLQNNIISVIENLHRLKSLVYINLALNNIQVIQNLESLESLEKLDLTINFIFDVRDVDRLKANTFLRELYLTGNPCSTYDGYREYVVATLPSLTLLDGKEVTKAERIKARQALPDLMDDIVEAVEDNRPDEVISTSAQLGLEMAEDEVIELSDEQQRDYWQEETEYTPRSRLEMHKKQEMMKRQEELKKNPPKPKKERKFFKPDGTPLNINEGAWEFKLDGQDIFSPNLVLDFPCYKHVDTSQIDLDVHPTYVRITMKELVFQLRLPESIHPDKGSAQRSQYSGHLVVTMPKVNPPRKRISTSKSSRTADEGEKGTGSCDTKGMREERLEVGNPAPLADYTAIVKNGKAASSSTTTNADNNSNSSSSMAAMLARKSGKAQTRDNDDTFIDDDDVPPLI